MRKLLTTGALLVLVVLVSGCASTPLSPSRRIIRDDKPEIGIISTVELGERLMTQRDIEVIPAVSVPNPTRNSFSIFPADFGGLYEIANEGTADVHFCGKHVLRDPLNNGKVQSLCWKEEEFKSKGIPYTRVEHISQRAQNLQRTLEYTGRVDNKLSFSYREYTESKDGVFIRPAYTQDFIFDMNQGATIGVKGARLKVIEATNTSLKYEVVTHFPR